MGGTIPAATARCLFERLAVGYNRTVKGAAAVNVKLRKIEVDAETADLLEARAAALGMSVADLLADLAGNESLLPPGLAKLRAGEGPWSPEAMEEDERRLAEFERTRMAAPWDDVKAWMESWGSPNELPIPKLREV